MRRSIPARLVFALVLSAACHSAPPYAAPTPQPSTPLPVTPVTYSTGVQVLEAMRAKYEGRWYSTVTFRQKTSRLAKDGKWNEQTWYEALRIPGQLRIDFDTSGAGSGVIYQRDSAFSVVNGKPLKGSASINELLVLGFDVYGQPASKTAAVLTKEGFDLSRVHRSTFEGRPMIVVGANDGDLHRRQFWVDADNLYFRRLIEPTPRDTSMVQDIRFTNYRKQGDAWISPRVEIYADGKLIFFEEYSDIRTDVTLDESLFDLARWKSGRHWMKP